jgi:hypothetical protein
MGIPTGDDPRYTCSHLFRCPTMNAPIPILNPESKKSLHFGVHYIFLPAVPINNQMALRFQQSLLANQIEFSTCRTEPETITLMNGQDAARSFQAKVYRPNPSLTGLLIVRPLPENSLAHFERECQAVTAAFSDTWFSPEQCPGAQFITKDVTLRCLYETSAPHSFQYLWEHKLGQSHEKLMCLNRPVLGGGISLVLPPFAQPGSENRQSQVTIKIESYHQDPKMLFVELVFRWPIPENHIMKDFGVDSLLQTAERYCNNELLTFIKGS